MTSALPRAAGLALGAAADRAFGDPRRFHPVAGFGRTMTAIERRIWRDQRATGVSYLALGVAVGAGPVLLADRALRERPLARTVLTATVTWAALGGRSLAGAGRALGARIAADDLAGARALAPTLVGRDPATLDAAGLSRAGLESVAENSSDAVVAPLVWGALLGAPGSRCTGRSTRWTRWSATTRPASSGSAGPRRGPTTSPAGPRPGSRRS